MKRDEFDDLLDSALASYGAAEPRPGLERRVLNTVLAAPKPFRFPRWIYAIPVLAPVLFLLIDRKESPRPTPPATATQTVTTPEIKRAADTPARRKHIRARSAPRPNAFPSPSPLTREERAALQLLARAPEQAAGFAFDTTIQPIRVEPLADIRSENEND